MSLIDTIAADIQKAMKSRQTLRLETLRMVRAALQEKVVERRPQGGLRDEDELTVLLQAAKKRKEAIDIYREKGRPDLAVQEEEELGIIQEYLPRQLTAEELRSIVQKIISTTGATSAADFGKVMPAVMKEVKGKADGKLVQDTVRKLLAG